MHGPFPDIVAQWVTYKSRVGCWCRRFQREIACPGRFCTTMWQEANGPWIRKVETECIIVIQDDQRIWFVTLLVWVTQANEPKWVIDGRRVKSVPLLANSRGYVAAKYIDFCWLHRL